MRSRNQRGFKSARLYNVFWKNSSRFFSTRRALLFVRIIYVCRSDIIVFVFAGA